MPPANQLSHRNISETSLPYKSWVNPILSEPYFTSLSRDILTSNKGYFERRPGFSDNVEVTPTTFTNLQRLFTWSRWDGTFIEMANDIVGGTSVVYKRIVGTDNSFVSLYTDSGSSNAFDFVVSNNQCYFANGNVVKKWDPTNGLSNWGITAPAAAPVLSTDGTYCGTAAGTNWTTPTNAQGKPNQTYAVYNNTTQDLLKCTNFGLAVPTGASITGIVVNVTGHAVSTTTAERQIDVGLTTDGSTLAGSYKTAQTLNLTTDTALNLGGQGDLWGNTTLSIAQVTAATFGVLIRDTNANANELDIDAVNVIVYWTATNGITGQVGWKYQVCYGNSKTGHVSSPSPTSNATGLVTNNSIGVTLVASGDAQVDQIKVFRTTDGGGGNYFEITGSPFSNSNQTIYDTTPDTSLNISSLAPIPTVNDPPPAGFSIPTYWNGRIWGAVNNKVWFSGFEEIRNGVAEECFPSGTAGNFWQFDQIVTAPVGLQDALVVFCPGRIYAITGDTLDTFRRSLFTNRRGCRNKRAIAVLGKLCTWYDTSGQIWSSDGTSLDETGLDIRPDISGLSGNLVLQYHVSGAAHWLVFSTGTAVLVYDLDTAQWMPPWSVALSTLHSGETSAGTYKLMGGLNNVAKQLNTSSFNDGGVTYQWKAYTNLFNIVPDFGRRFSYLAQGIYDEPSRLGTPWYLGVERNNNALANAKIEVDDDPTASSTNWIDITGQLSPPEQALNRTQGLNLFQDVYSIGKPAGRRVAINLIGANADQADKVYSMFLAYKEQR